MEHLSTWKTDNDDDKANMKHLTCLLEIRNVAFSKHLRTVLFTDSWSRGAFATF